MNYDNHLTLTNIHALEQCLLCDLAATCGIFPAEYRQQKQAEKQRWHKLAEAIYLSTRRKS